GALLAGDAVSQRIATGIIRPDMLPRDGAGDYHQVMLSALLGAAIWISFASWRGLPVSTTHSIVGGIAGAGMVTFGAGAVAWGSLASITLGWVAAPLLAAAIAAGLLAL
ncbi:inorganic phosphate transporter, partial [Glutamicibacter soli]